MGKKTSIFRLKQFSIIQDHTPMKVGTDSDLLGSMAAGGRHILDIGTGTGILALMMAQRYPEARVEAVEIDDNAVLDASRNFADSPFASRITLHHCSFQDFLVREEGAGRQGASEAAANGMSVAVNDATKATVAGTLQSAGFDSIVSNPPYFDKSLECPDQGRTRARHTSSLPFPTLAQGAYRLLEEGGTFSVILPPEVQETFTAECIFAGFALKEIHIIKSVPDKQPKRYVIVYQKGKVERMESFTHCMRNADLTYSQWYNDLLKDFLLDK